MDILRTLREAVDKAQVSGETFRQFAKQLEPLLRQKGWWGIKEQTEPLTGERREVQLGSPRRTRQLRPYFLYQLGPSQEHRLQPVQWNGLILSVGDPFWDSYYPPNGWGCKYRLRQISRREHDRLAQGRRHKLEAPVIDPREWVNKRSGEVTHAPKGIDPGWNVNPGKDRARQPETLLSEKIQSAHPADQKVAQGTWNS